MRVLKIIFLVVLLSLSGSVCRAATFGHGKSGSSPTSETVTANLSSTGYTIPANFVGLGIEQNDFNSGLYQGTSGTSAFSLLAFLGSNGSIRIGGSSEGAGLTPTLATNFANSTLALGSGWSIIWGLNSGASSSQAVTDAGYWITAMGGTSRLIFSAGNEGNWNLTNFNSFYSAITAVYSTAQFELEDCGTCGTSTMEADAAASTPGMAGLALITYHKYPAAYASPAQFIFDTEPVFCSGTPVNCLATFASGRVRVTEMAGISGGGVQGITDRMMASTWFINSAINLANGGYQGVNAFNSNNGSPVYSHPAYYSPLIYHSGDSTWWPSPEFYGMILFSKIEGQVTATVTNSGSGNVNRIATIGPNGNANILVSNSDPGNPVVVTPAQSSSWTTAKVWDVEPASSQWCFDPNATYGGAQIGESGAWTGAYKTISNGGTVTIQPCGAAVIEIQP